MRVPCPTCKGPSSLDRSNLHRPFCSERCRLVDLGGWLDERFRIAGEKAMDEAPTAPADMDRDRPVLDES